MGCNNTKLNSSEGEGLPAKIRPLLRQRIEEFRKRRNVRGGEEGDLSKKELLKGDDHDHDDGGNFQTHSSDHENEVVEKTETQPPKEQTVVRVVAPVEKLSKVVPFPWPASECETVKKPENIPIIPMPQQEKHVEKKPEIPIIPMLPQQESKQEEGNTKHDDDHDDEYDDDDDEDDEDEDDDDEDEESEFGRYIGPGSPSFRIYCIEAEKRKEKEIRDANARYIDKSICHEEKEKEKEKEKETIPLHNKSHSTDSDESATSASASGNEVVEMEPAAAPLKRRKRHKMKKLKKNLLNVKNIPMNRMMACAGNNDRRRSLLADK